MRTKNLKELSELKRITRKDYYFLECPICNSVFGTDEAKSKSCSANCDKLFQLKELKINEAREIIKACNWAMTSDEINFGGIKGTVVITGFNAETIANGKTESYYVIMVDDMFHNIQPSSPLKKHYEINPFSNLFNPKN